MSNAAMATLAHADGREGQVLTLNFSLLENFLRKSISRKGTFTLKFSKPGGTEHSKVVSECILKYISLCRKSKFQLIFVHIQYKNSQWKSVMLFNANFQGCGLGLDVSVSRRSRDVLTSRLGLVSDKVLNISVSSRSRPKRSCLGSRAISSRRDISCSPNWKIVQFLLPWPKNRSHAYVSNQ